MDDRSAPRSSPDAAPRAALAGAIRWTYSAAELKADAVVHGVGLVAVAVASAVLLVAIGGTLPGATLAAVGVYLGTLVLSLGASAAYNVWPVTRTKWILRRVDHSAIYGLIAGTYTPFLAQLGHWRVLAAVWVVAGAGMALKLAAPGRFDRVAIALYLLLGWSSVLIFGSVVANLPTAAVWLTVAGGVLYSGGVVFHVLDRRFHNAIWHAFVLAAAGLHFGAVVVVMLAP